MISDLIAKGKLHQSSSGMVEKHCAPILVAHIIRPIDLALQRWQWVIFIMSRKAFITPLSGMVYCKIHWIPYWMTWGEVLIKSIPYIGQMCIRCSWIRLVCVGINRCTLQCKLQSTHLLYYHGLQYGTAKFQTCRQDMLILSLLYVICIINSSNDVKLS